MRILAVNDAALRCIQKNYSCTEGKLLSIAKYICIGQKTRQSSAILGYIQYVQRAMVRLKVLPNDAFR